MHKALLDINLFGACIVRSTDPYGFEITGSKHKALFALLATAAFGRRTRAFLQDMLWGTSSYDGGRQSLRRALSDIKSIMGSDFDRLISPTHSEISLDLNRVQFIGRPGQGDFLEGIDIRDEGFNDWLRSIRNNPDQVYGLYSARHQTPPASIQPSIAIIPFQAYAGNKRHTILGDWLAEEVSRSLSRSNLLSVISHLSSRRLAGYEVDLQSIRTKLGVDYCLSGSVRPLGNEAVLDVDFVDAASGMILWTRQFRSSLSNLCSCESPVVAELVQAIGYKIASESLRHANGRNIKEIDDHRLLLAGVSMMHSLRLKRLARSRALIEEAIRRAPLSAENHAWLGEWYVMAITNGWSTDHNRDALKAKDCTARALDIDPENAFCLSIDGVIHSNLLTEIETANQRFESALRLNPNDSMAWLCSGVLHAYRDNGTEAVARVEKARQLSPIDPLGYFFDALSATAYLADEDYVRALDLAEHSLQSNDRHCSTLRAKIVAQNNLGQLEAAQKTAQQLIRLQPNFTIVTYRQQHPAATSKVGHRAIKAMQEAGIS